MRFSRTRICVCAYVRVSIGGSLCASYACDAGNRGMNEDSPEIYRRRESCMGSANKPTADYRDCF